MKTNVFEKIPSNFFNLLASVSNNSLYSGCLLSVYDIFEHEVSFKIRRDVVRDTISAYILSETEKTEWQDKEFSNVNDCSGEIIRQFYKAGWLIEDIDDVTYEKQVVMTESGIALAEFLLQLIKPVKAEYSSYVFNIYNLLQNRQQWEKDPYALALKAVYNQSKQLANALKKLSTSIKSIIEKVVQEETLEELTNNLLSYCEGVFIKEYSRLVKEQNIHIYRLDIINRLESLKKNYDDYELMIIGCYDNEDMETEIEAEQRVDNMFRTTTRFLTDDYDKLMNDIQKKINIYLNLAVGRARFLINHDKNTRGNVSQVVELLLYSVDSLQMEQDLSNIIDDLFNIYTQEFVDTTSLRFPQNKRSITKSTCNEIPEMTQEDINKAAADLHREAYNPYSKDDMKKYVSEIMGNKTEISAEEFPVAEKGDVLALISSVAYGLENGYLIAPTEDYFTANGFCIRNFTISLLREEK